ncbi:MAG: peptidoglycan DD-metalloendopeptidase family protein [Candidatus Yanofskybacteria bacterium]|nr:peptidoglycan DD-metalloendopeptidase family protein [Candidatus Yanofskybacteria bacterium]
MLLKNWRIKILVFFLLTVCYSMQGGGFVYAQTATELKAEIERYEQEITRLKKEQEELGQNISSTQSKAKTLQNQINNLNGKVKYLENQIYLTSVNINKTGTEIESLEGNIFDIQKKVNYSRDAIGRLMLSLYKQDKENLLTILLKNANISDFFIKAQAATSINLAIFSEIEKLRDNQESLEGQKHELENKKASLENLKKQQGSEKVALSQTKAETSNLLKATKGKEVEYQKLLTKAEELEREANLEVFRLEEKLRQAIDPNSLPLARPGILNWPVTGRISQAYGCIISAFARRYYPDCNNAKGGFHNGLDVAASHGTPVAAADDGTVIAMGSAPSAYGVWLAVEHTNGLVTAYTHLSVRNVSMGQKVKRGDTVGKMGSTGLSTGSHIHFMVYAPKTFTVKESKISGTLPIGATLNPSDYLD